MIDVHVSSDAPSSVDLLSFDRYVEPILSILTDARTCTPFTTGIFGSWGSGKSTLLAQLDHKLSLSHDDRFVRVHFNPWIHRGEDNMLVPLLHTLQDAIEEDPSQRFAKSAKKLGDVLLNLGADLLLRTATAGATSLEALETLEQSYLKRSMQVKSDLRSLHQALAREIAEISKSAKLVFFIDDLDRCDPTEIIDLLEAVKLFLHVEGAFFVIAVDKQVVDRGIAVKYHKFGFEEELASLGAEYLEKMVQLPLTLLPLSKSQILGFMSKLDPPASVARHLDLLSILVFPNPRKIKRIMNILAVISAIVERTEGLKDLDGEMVARLVVLQVQSPDLYAKSTREHRILPALEAVYRDDKDPARGDDFKEYGTRGASIRDACLEFYDPDGYLPELFRNSTFGVEENLPLYLSMMSD